MNTQTPVYPDPGCTVFFWSTVATQSHAYRATSCSDAASRGLFMVHGRLVDFQRVWTGGRCLYRRVRDGDSVHHLAPSIEAVSHHGPGSTTTVANAPPLSSGDFAVRRRPHLTKRHAWTDVDCPRTRTATLRGVMSPSTGPNLWAVPPYFSKGNDQGLISSAVLPNASQSCR